MAYQYACPNCGTIEPSAGGSSVECKRCGQVYQRSPAPQPSNPEGEKWWMDKAFSVVPAGPKSVPPIPSAQPTEPASTEPSGVKGEKWWMQTPTRAAAPPPEIIPAQLVVEHGHFAAGGGATVAEPRNWMVIAAAVGGGCLLLAAAVLFFLKNELAPTADDLAPQDSFVQTDAPSSAQEAESSRSNDRYAAVIEFDRIAAISDSGARIHRPFRDLDRSGFDIARCCSESNSEHSGAPAPGSSGVAAGPLPTAPPVAAPPAGNQPPSAAPSGAASPAKVVGAIPAKPGSPPDAKKAGWDDGRADGPLLSEAVKSVVLIEHPLAAGSGFVVGPNLVTTNAHVVDGAFPDEIRVQFGTETGSPRKINSVLYFDRVRDLCLIEVETGVPPLTLRGDYSLHPGDRVALVGNPAVKGGMLLRNAVNHGKLVSVVRMEGHQDYYQIDAVVDSGWSGGPVLDDEGRVIGVVAMKATDSAAAEIRRDHRRLDESFRQRNAKPVSTGLSYGIPGAVLARIVKNPMLRDEKRQAVASDTYAAQTIFRRLRFLAGLAMLRIQINVPHQVRAEAQTVRLKSMMASIRLPASVTSKIEFVPLLPEFIAEYLRSKLESREVRTMENQFRKHLDARMEAVSESPHVADEVKKDLNVLAKRVEVITKYAEKPATLYAAYSTKFLTFDRELKSLFRRMETALQDADSDEATDLGG